MGGSKLDMLDFIDSNVDLCMYSVEEIRFVT